jgi:hypothetical protein
VNITSEPNFRRDAEHGKVTICHALAAGEDIALAVQAKAIAASDDRKKKAGWTAAEKS